MKTIKKAIAVILTVLMAISMMPFSAFTAFAASPTAAQALVPRMDDGKVLQAKNLIYAGKEWTVVGVGDTGVQLADGAVSKEEGETTLVLLAWNNWSSSYVKFANSDNNDYATSNLRTLMEGYVTSESIGSYYTGSQAWLNDLVAPRTLEGGATQWQTGYEGWQTEDKILGTTITDATLWPMSAAERQQVYPYRMHQASMNGFWLRTPALETEGNVAAGSSQPMPYVQNDWVQYNAAGVRPALCLNVTDDMFVTPTEGSVQETYELRKHDFGYTASGATLTAQCSSSVCELNGETFNLTISASNADYDGNAYSGASISDTTDWTAVGLAVPTIQYEGTGSTTYAKSATAPTDAGTYVATISAGGATASAAFSIAAPEPTKPTATVNEIDYADVQAFFPDAPAMDVVYQFVANNDGDDVYKTYNADFVVSFDKAVPQGAVKLYGQYGNYPITECPITKDLAANEEYRLLKDAMGMDMTYQQILDLVGTFYCGAKYTAAAAGATMTIKLAIYETAVDPETGDVTETGTEVEIEDAEQTDTAPALPQATVTDITNTEENELGLDAAYKFEAPAGTTAYDDEYCDFIVRFDQDVTSDDIELWGKYGQYDWTNLASEASGDAYTFEAGKDYYLLRDIVQFPLTYADIRTIGTFYCGVNSHYGANGVTMDVELALYEEPAQGEEPVATVLDDEEFVAPDKPDPATQDEISITTADEIDVNLYLAETGEEATVEYTFNTTPDIQEDTQETVTVDFDSLPEVAGKRKLTVRVAPAQIRDNIDIVIKDAQGGEIRNYENYSVAEYCDQLAQGNYSTNIKNLAKSVLDYGKAAANFFGYNASAFTNQADNFNSFTFDTTGFTAIANGIDVQKVRYVATSVPSLRFEVDMTEAEAERYTVETDKGYAAKFVKVEDKVILQVTGIPASKLGETITVSVKDAHQDEIATIQYTPIIYAYNAAKTNNAELARLGETIGQYSAAANAVFA